MQSAREELLSAFRLARKVQVGTNLFIGIDAAAEKKIKAALERGDTITEAGVKKWVVESPIFDKAKAGSAAYTWRGEKIRVEQTLVTKTPDGKITRAHYRFAWRNFDSVFA